MPTTYTATASFATSGTAGTSVAYKTVTVTVALGDLVVAAGVSADASGAGTAALATVSGPTGAWTVGRSNNANGSCGFVMGHAVATGAGSVTVRITVPNSTPASIPMGGGVWVIPNASWTGTPTYTPITFPDADAKVNVTLSTTSTVLYAAGDWSAAGTPGTASTPTGGTNDSIQFVSSNYGAALKRWVMQGPGTRAYGPTSPAGNQFVGAVVTVPVPLVAGPHTVSGPLPVSLVAAGTAPAATVVATPFPLAYPTGIAEGDLLVAIIGVKRTAAVAPTLTDWTLASTSVVFASGVAAGAGVGEQRIYVLTRVVPAGGLTGSATFTVTGADNTNGRMLGFRVDSTGYVDPVWDVTGTSFAHASLTAWGGTGAANLSVEANDRLVAALLVADDTARSGGVTLTATGATLGTVVDTGHNLVTTGGDSALSVFGAPVTAGTSSAAPAATLTGGAAETGGGIFLRIRCTATVQGVISQAASRFYDDGTETGSTALAAQDATPSVDISGGDVNLGLRVRLQETGVGPVASSDDFQLQWEKNTNGAWSVVTAAPTEALLTSNSGTRSTALTMNGTQIRGQTFLGDGQTLSRAGFVIWGSSSPTGSVYAVLYAHTGTFGTSGVPTGSELARSQAVAATSITTVTNTTAVTYFTFDSGPVLSDGVPYAIGIVGVGVTSPAAIQLERTLDQHPGNNFLGATAGTPPYTALPTDDLKFEVYTVSGGNTAVPYDSPSLTDGAATTNRLTGGTGTFTSGKVSEDGLVENLGWLQSNHTELLYSLTLKAADLAGSDTLRFRVLRSGVTVTYTTTPTLTATVGGGGAFNATATLTGTGSTSATGLVARVAAATLAATAAITSAGVVASSTTASLSGSGAITATGSVSAGAVNYDGTATLTGTGATTATGAVGKVATVTLTGTAAASATGLVGTNRTATLSGTAGSTASGVVGASTTATLGGTGTGTATGVVGKAATAALSGTGSTTAAGAVVSGTSATATLIGTAGTGPTFSDDFNRANGAVGSGWSLLTGSSLIVSSNEVASPDTGTNHMRTVAVAPSSDLYAQATIKTSGASLGVGARFPAAGSTESGYVWRYNGTDSQLFAVSSGSFTAIGSAYVAGLSVGAVLRIEVEGTAIRGYVDGVLRASTTNATVTTGTTASLRIGGTAARMDDFSMGSLTAGAATGYVGTITPATLTGTGSTTASGFVARTTTSTLSGTGVTSATGVVARSTTAALAGTGATTATGVALAAGSSTATLSGTASTTAAGVVARSTTATLGGVGTVTATGTTGATASRPGAGTVTAVGVVGAQGTATPTGVGGITALGATDAATTATLTGTGAITATGVVVVAGGATATQTGTGSTTATGVVGTSTSSTLTGTGSTTASGMVARSTTANIPGTGTILATGVAVAVGTRVATLTGTGSITTTGVVARATTSSLPGTGTVTAVGEVNRSTTASLAGTGTVTATGALGYTRTATLTGTGSTSATRGPLGVTGAPSVDGVGVLVAVGHLATRATVTLTGAGTITTAASTVGAREATLTGLGTITATGFMFAPPLVPPSGMVRVPADHPYGREAASGYAAVASASPYGREAPDGYAHVPAERVPAVSPE